VQEDDLIFLGAAILLAQMIGDKRAPADENEIHIATANALKLQEEVKKQCDKIRAGLRTDGVMEAEKGRRANSRS